MRWHEGREEVLVTKLVILAAAVAGAVAAVTRRRKAQAGNAVWREATSDSAH